MDITNIKASLMMQVQINKSIYKKKIAISDMSFIFRENLDENLN